MKTNYTINVSNLGTVYNGYDEAEARKEYAECVDMSENSRYWRGKGENVTLMADEDVIKEHTGYLYTFAISS